MPDLPALIDATTAALLDTSGALIAAAVLSTAFYGCVWGVLALGVLRAVPGERWS